jgi:hypothetical protein
MGKKWGHYAVGGRSQPVTCIYCGRLTPRVKAIPVRKGSWLDTKVIPGLDRRRSSSPPGRLTPVSPAPSIGECCDQALLSLALGLSLV